MKIKRESLLICVALSSCKDAVGGAASVGEREGRSERDKRQASQGNAAEE